MGFYSCNKMLYILLYIYFTNRVTYIEGFDAVIVET
jgi:hypothetical protein